MIANQPAKANLHLTIKTDFTAMIYKDWCPLSLDRFLLGGMGGLQTHNGNRFKPASYLLRLKTLSPLWRDIRQTVFSFCVIQKFVSVIGMAVNLKGRLPDPFIKVQI
jgi:hypothetical protein